jgi:hypothetical protein
MLLLVEMELHFKVLQAEQALFRTVVVTQQVVVAVLAL